MKKRAQRPQGASDAHSGNSVSNAALVGDPLQNDAKLRLTKSPFNEAVGRVVYRLRSKKQLDYKSAARALDVSHTYLRAIELGSRALPPYAAVGLSNAFGANFLSASALLVVIGYLDVRERNEQHYDLAEIVDRAERLKSIAPQLATQLDWLIRTIAELRVGAPRDRGNSNRIIVEALERFLSAQPSGAADQRAGRPADFIPLADNKLSPIFADIVQALATQLSYFPPHTDRNGLKIWEEQNSHRVASVMAYVDSPQTILTSLQQFNWSFLSNRYHPTVKILTPYSGDILAMQENVRVKLNDLFKKKNDLDTGFVDNFFLIAHDTNSIATRDGLLFDFVTRSMPESTESAAVRRERMAKGRYRSFLNAWVYDIVPDEPGRHHDGRRLIGFLDSYEEDARSDTYAVVLDRNHVAHWWRTIQAAWDAANTAPARGTTLPPKRSARAEK